MAHEQLVSVARKIIDPWSKLAAAYRLHGDQPAIGKLAASRPQAASAIGDLFAADKQWERAIEIYSTAISKRTTDVLLLWKRARAFEALKNWDGAAADWSRAASGNPEGAKLLAEFARRLAAGGKASLANDQFEKARALYERSLDADPENDVVATELAEMLLAMHANDPGRLKRRANRFALLKATDPWLKLAVAYAVSGRNDAAVQYFGRALQRANGDEARKPIVELAARFDDVLIVLAERQPDLAPLQLALARKLAERGKQRLAQKQPAEALAQLQRAREILTRLRAEPEETARTTAGANEADQAARAARRMDLMDSELRNLFVALAKAQTGQGQINEAVASFTAALDLAKNRGRKARIIASVVALAAAGGNKDGSASPIDDAAKARLAVWLSTG